MSESRGRFRPAGTRTEDGENETSGAEKVLVVVLAVFIAIGAVWGYVKLDEVADADATHATVRERQLLNAEEFAALKNHRRASSSVRRARTDLRGATRSLELRREAYRTALDAGRPSADLRREYEAAQAELASAERELAAAVSIQAATGPDAVEARQQLTELRHEEAKRAEEDRTRHDRIVFGLRLALLILMLGGAYLLLSRLRSRNSRYLPAALAWIGATAVLAIVMAGDYTGSYIEFEEVGPLAISIAGIALTLVAIVSLQRFMAKRIPARRVRRGECPFCGYPLRDGSHCEGCGRTVVASCSTCHRDRRVGTPRCGYCGNA
jgi:hypothetical protein